MNIPPPLTPTFEISNNNFNIEPIPLPPHKYEYKNLPIQPIPEEIKMKIQSIQNYIKNNPNKAKYLKEKLNILRIQYLMSFCKSTINNFHTLNNKWQYFHPKKLEKILAVIYNDISRESWEKLNPNKERKRKMYYDEKDLDEEKFLINDIMKKVHSLLLDKNDEKRNDIYNLNLDIINNDIEGLKNLMKNSVTKFEKSLYKFSSVSTSSEDEHEPDKNPITYQMSQTDQNRFGGHDPLLELL